MKTLLNVTLLVICALLFSAQAVAGPIWPDMAPSQNPPLISVGAGVFNTNSTSKVADFQIEYTSTFTEIMLGRLLGGLMLTAQGGALAYTGLGWDVILGKSRLVMIPGISTGLYFDGWGKKLGFPLEFRSSIGLAYQLKSQSRLGAQFAHISNFSFGKQNPGVELLMLYYAIPFYSFEKNWKPIPSKTNRF